MVDAEVKWIDTGGRPYPIPGSGPLMLYMTAGIGRKDDDGVCNAAWIAQRAKGGSAYWPRGHLIVEQFDETHVMDTLQQLVDTFRRSVDWQAFAERLNRYLLWECEDLDDFQGEVVPPTPRHN